MFKLTVKFAFVSFTAMLPVAVDVMPELNPWFADRTDPENKQAAEFAEFTHIMLYNEGYE